MYLPRLDACTPSIRLTHALYTPLSVHRGVHRPVHPLYALYTPYIRLKYALVSAQLFLYINNNIRLIYAYIRFLCALLRTKIRKNFACGALKYGKIFACGALKYGKKFRLRRPKMR